MKKNQKGFTLVELLAVIVILAVIILIAINAVLPQMTKARKNSFADEVMNYAKAAETKYVSDSQDDEAQVGNITEGICYNLKTPNYGLHGEYVSKNDDSYTGIVVIKKQADSNLYDKYVFIASSKYSYNSNDRQDGTLSNPLKKISATNVNDSTSINYADCCAYKKAKNSSYTCVAADYQTGVVPAP